MDYTKIMMNDKALIEACINNDRLAQKELYEKYKKAMYTIACRITGDFNLANDVLQDAFINIFRALPKFRGDSTLGAWIKTIVVRTAIRASKKQRNFSEINDVVEHTLIDWGHALDIEYLEKAIFSLSAGYRAVFTLIEIEGYTHKDAADLLGISTGTSKSQLFHAKRKLRDLLKNQID